MRPQNQTFFVACSANFDCKMSIAISLCFVTLLKATQGCNSAPQSEVSLCGKNDNLLTLTPKSQVVIKSPNPGISKNWQCDWKIFNQNVQSCQAVFTCDKFNIPFTPNCNQNYVELIDINDKVKVKFCGVSNNLHYPLKDIVYLEIKSRAMDPKSHFDCKVLCDGKLLSGVKPSISTTTKKPPVNSEPTCGRSMGALIDMKIVGGSDVAPGTYPWQVMLKDKQIFFCGGALIHPKYILTAGNSKFLLGNRKLTFSFSSLCQTQKG